MSRHNEFAKDLKDAHTAALVGSMETDPHGKAILEVLARKLVRVKTSLRNPGANDAEWKKDARWLLAQEELLEDLAALPQAARERNADKGDEQ